MSFRNEMVEIIHDFYRDGFKTREGRITKLQKYISNYFQHLKADLAKPMEHDECDIEINVHYVKEGLFAEIRIEKVYIKFFRIKKQPDRIVVKASKIITNEYPLRMQPKGCEFLGESITAGLNIYLYSFNLDSLKEYPEDIDKRLDFYLEKIFCNEVKCIQI